MEYSREFGLGNFGEIVKRKKKPWFNSDSLVLYRLQKINTYKKEHEGKKYVSCVLDTETTGFGKIDEITSLSIIPFIFDSKMDVCHVLNDKIYDEYNETKKRIPQEVQELTQITNEMIKGKKIDWQYVEKFLSKMKIVLAHNSSFDKRMMKKYIDVDKYSWGCSVKNINWKKQLFPTSSLPTLCRDHGFHYRAHASLDDSRAVIHLLAHKNPTTGKSNLSELLTDIYSPTYKLMSDNTPFNKKEDVKEQGFKWDPDEKCWWKGFKNKSEAEIEKKWLIENIGEECQYDKIIEDMD